MFQSNHWDSKERKEQFLLEILTLSPKLFKFRDFKTCFSFNLFKLCFALDDGFHFYLEKEEQNRR